MTPPAESQVDPRILRALGDPARQQIVVALSETSASAATLSTALGQPLPEVRAHLRELIADDAIEAVDGPEVPPDDQRFRAMIRPFLDDAHWAALPAEDRHALFGLALRALSERIEEGMSSGGFGHVQTHVSFTRLLLDEQGWQQVTDLLAGVLEEVMEIEADCADRRARGEPGELAATSLAMLHFGRPERRVQRAPDTGGHAEET